MYLPWLAGQCRKNGVVFKRAVFKHITDAANTHHTGKKADLIVNCTGISSKFLGGVQDNKLYPGRGQVVIVRNDVGLMASTSGTDDGEDELMYMMTRAAGKKTATLRLEKTQELTPHRRRHNTRRLLSAEQLGSPP